MIPIALSKVIVEQTDEARENECSEYDVLELRRCLRELGVDGGENMSNSSRSIARRERSSCESYGQHVMLLDEYSTEAISHDAWSRMRLHDRDSRSLATTMT